MGGYGALRNGLKYHDTFSHIAGFSSALVLSDIDKRTDDVPFFIESRSYAEQIFGDLKQVAQSDKNPRYLVETLSAQGTVLPRIYLSCGLSDSFIGENRKFAKFLESQKVDVTFQESEGGHEWDFWNREIRSLLDWLPLGPDISLKEER